MTYNIDHAIYEAHRLGHQHGLQHAAAGTHTDSPLSGEWAGDPTPADVLAAVQVSSDEDHAGDVLDAYEAGYAAAALKHDDYPHEPGYLMDCPACESACHCTPGDAECVYHADDNPHAYANGV